MVLSGCFSDEPPSMPYAGSKTSLAATSRSWRMTLPTPSSHARCKWLAPCQYSCSQSQSRFGSFFLVSGLTGDGQDSLQPGGIEWAVQLRVYWPSEDHLCIRGPLAAEQNAGRAMSERPPAPTLSIIFFFSRIALIAFPLDLRYKDDCKYIRDDFGQRRSALRGSSTPPPHPRCSP